MNVQDKLIYRPEAVRLRQRTLFGLMTLIAWSAYLYLWLPFVTLLLWLVGIETASLRLLNDRPAPDYGVMFELLAIAALCSALLIGWAEYNRVRFQGKGRRSSPLQVGIGDVAARLGADENVASQLQSARIGIIVMDERAVPTSVRVIAPLVVP